MQDSIESLNQPIKKWEAYAHGSPRHLSLLMHYLDLMEERNTKGT
jgi:hypothetical protein